MRKYVPAAILATIVALLGAAALALVFGSPLGSHKASAPAKPSFDTASCVKLESGGKIVCTKDVTNIAASVKQCVTAQGAQVCGQSLVQQLVSTCKSSGYGDAPCTRDALRITAVIEANITGKSAAGYLQGTGISSGG